MVPGPTIKVDVVTRDRLKAQAAQAHLTLGQHLARLADAVDLGRGRPGGARWPGSRTSTPSPTCGSAGPAEPGATSGATAPP